MPRRKKSRRTRKRRKKVALAFVGGRTTPKGEWYYWVDEKGRIVTKFRRRK